MPMLVYVLKLSIINSFQIFQSFEYWIVLDPEVNSVKSVARLICGGGSQKMQKDMTHFTKAKFAEEGTFPSLRTFVNKKVGL